MYCKHICRIHSLQWNLWGKEIVFCHFCLVFKSHATQGSQVPNQELNLCAWLYESKKEQSSRVLSTGPPGNPCALHF